LRSIGSRIEFLSGQLDDVNPQLLAEPGVGPVVAAQLLISWSHRGRVSNQEAFASLAGVAPLEASSGQHVRHRLDRGGDRALNQGLHTIAMTRMRYYPTSSPTAKPGAAPKAKASATFGARSSAR
jgi:transposase